MLWVMTARFQRGEARAVNDSNAADKGFSNLHDGHSLPSGSGFRGGMSPLDNCCKETIAVVRDEC